MMQNADGRRCTALRMFTVCDDAAPSPTDIAKGATGTAVRSICYDCYWDSPAGAETLH